MINEEKLEDVIAGLKCCHVINISLGHCPNECPYLENSGLPDCAENLRTDILDIIDLLTPREITKEEWEQWKTTKYRDPLYYIWMDDATLTPFLALKPEDIHEPAYLMGQIKIFNTKPTIAQRIKMIEEKVKANDRS